MMHHLSQIINELAMLQPDLIADTNYIETACQKASQKNVNVLSVWHLLLDPNNSNGLLDYNHYCQTLRHQAIQELSHQNHDYMNAANLVDILDDITYFYQQDDQIKGQYVFDVTNGQINNPLTYEQLALCLTQL